MPSSRASWMARQKQLVFQAAMLILVGHQQGQVGLVSSVHPVKPAHANNFRPPGTLELHHQSQFAVMIAETNPHQPLMRDPRFQAELAKITQIYAAVRERLLELDDQRLVFRADGADGYSGPILRRPAPHILHRIRPDRGPGR